MDCLEAIKSRRSIRKYKDMDVSDDIIREILDCGRQAPTGGNMQPWEFIVVKDRDTIGKVVETTYLGFSRGGGQHQIWLKTAPVLLVVCCDFKRTVARYGESGKRIALMDTSAAIENILVAATALNIASCWVSGFDVQALSELLSIPEPVEPLAVLPLGYAEGTVTSPNKFSLDEMIHYEQYGNVCF